MQGKKATTYVCKAMPEQVAQLQTLLKGQGWEFSEIPYAYWKAAKEKTNVVAYRSGKLTVQGSGTEEFVTFTLEPEILKTVGFGYEDAVSPSAKKQEPFTPHAGIDESGKGDFFGPLVIAGVYADCASAEELRRLDVKDSKLIKSTKAVYQLAPQIRKAVGGRFATVVIGPEAYNRLYAKIGNLNRLLAWGHARTIENLLDKAPECKSVLADKFGAEHLIKNALMQKGRNIRLEQRVKAESDLAVAAASILAREQFLRVMDKLSDEAGIKLPRGAGPAVEQTARLLFGSHGADVLSKYVKRHFKTWEKVLAP